MKLAAKLAVAAAVISQCVHGLHLRKDLVEVENDAIVLVHATAVIDGTTSRIAHLPISPAGSVDGTKGLVYILPDLVDCRPVPRSDEYLAAAYIRIALIADDGKCPVQAKIKQAQYDGAMGALVYNTSLSASNLSTDLSRQLAKGKPVIPIVAVDRDYGETLGLEVTSLLDEAAVNENGRYRAIFASIYADEDGEHLSVWEISLISLVIILGICFCTSLAFHLSAGRRRMQQSRRNGDAGDLSKQIQTLPSCALDRLALRTVSEADVLVLSEHTTPLDAILNPSGKRRSLKSPSTIAPSAGNSSSNSSCCCLANDCEGCEKPQESVEHNDSPTKAEDSILRGCIATCIVCIDDFVAGSKMRILPCGHNYHIECIDPWLTTKSSLCPLCKYDTRDVLTDLERSLSGPRILASQNMFGNAIDSTSLYSDTDGSSFMAESHSRISLAHMLGRLRCAAQGVATPVHALTRRLSRNRGSSAPRIADVGTSPGNSGSQAHNIGRPCENDNTIIAGTTPATHVVSVDKINVPEMTELSSNGVYHNTFVEVGKSDTYSLSADRDGAETGDDRPAAGPHTDNGTSQVGDAGQLSAMLDTSMTRISLSESVISEGDFLEYFR
ncbi:hypothetical protein H4R26_002638 [Coemansia thaxteri]|uniref:RING-type domain-containing protein n=1 Tax=Coemansia thaxteri TaxID=2663907 RepID=A0A9W8BCL0_9FUNG|nr:hypothetical protein H4R26_002638 [Coemansia thaxteri]